MVKPLETTSLVKPDILIGLLFQIYIFNLCLNLTSYNPRFLLRCGCYKTRFRVSTLLRESPALGLRLYKQSP